jgi:hypothetical protein
LPTAALEALEAEFREFLGPDYRGELQNFLTGYEGIGKEILKGDRHS